MCVKDRINIEVEMALVSFVYDLIVVDRYCEEGCERRERRRNLMRKFFSPLAVKFLSLCVCILRVATREKLFH